MKEEMDIETITKIHTEPGDILIVEVAQATLDECRKLATFLQEKLDPRVVVLVTDKPMSANLWSVEELNEIIERRTGKKS